MQGYEPEKAIDYVAKRIKRSAYMELGAPVESFLRQAQSLDLQFMRETGALDAHGFAGDAAYDEDEAFEYIVEGIVKLRGLDDEQAIIAADMVNAYMLAHEGYLKKEGLVES